MRSMSLVVGLSLACSVPALAQGLILTTDREAPCLAIHSQRVDVAIDEQVAVTKVEQNFRNHTGRPLEATFVFPIPAGAAVKEFAMWVDGKRVKGELVEADKARQVYHDIVRRLKDPGLLEYVGGNLLRLSAFPVPARGEQKIELSYTHLAPTDAGLTEYTYPVRADSKATRTLEDFTLKVTLKSKHPIHTVYSPTHAVSVSRPNDREAIVGFEKNQALLDRDFQLFYATGGREVGLTTLAHRSTSREDGYVLLLISPRSELDDECRVPRDLVFVLDTSGSMAEDGKIDQAKRALKHCLGRLPACDRFAILPFATTVNRYAERLAPATSEEIERAKKWVDRLEAGGGTAIDDALSAALELRGSDPSRTFTIAFLTDGKPTLGESDPEKIVANLIRKDREHTRVFSFGVGHGVNATFLDRLAEETRAASVYVRPGEDLEVKVSSFFDKIRRPVLTDLRLSVGTGIRLVEMYPPRLPDLFYGGQLAVLARYQGSGETAVKLSGRLGKTEQNFTMRHSSPPAPTARRSWRNCGRGERSGISWKKFVAAGRIVNWSKR